MCSFRGVSPCKCYTRCVGRASVPARGRAGHGRESARPRDRCRLWLRREKARGGRNCMHYAPCPQHPSKMDGVCMGLWRRSSMHAKPRNEHTMCSFRGFSCSGRERVCVRARAHASERGRSGVKGRVHEERALCILDAQRRIACTRSHKTNILCVCFVASRAQGGVGGSEALICEKPQRCLPEHASGK